jgi:hypothetical protein
MVISVWCSHGFMLSEGVRQMESGKHRIGKGKSSKYLHVDAGVRVADLDEVQGVYHDECEPRV